MARTATLRGEPVIVGDRIDRVESYEHDHGSALSWIVPLVLAALLATWLYNTYARDNAAVAPVNDTYDSQTYEAPAPAPAPAAEGVPAGSNGSI